MSDASRSHITLLKPRDPSFGGSSRMTTDFLFNMVSLERDRWTSRKEFFFSALAFCLSLPCLWRFPKELLLHGSGSFLWLYILFTSILGNSLVFFEVALGQYSSKGFSRVFAMCPLFEGVSYSMGLYCLIVSTFYNFLNVISFTYFYSSFFSALPYKNCSKGATCCVQNSTNVTCSPEYLFFHYKAILFHESENIEHMNWRNVGVLFFLWVLVCIAILKGIKTARWFPMVYSPFPYIILITVLATSSLVDGSLGGIQQMFLPNSDDLLDTETWRHALEQSIVSLGLGMGPLITYGSFSKFQSPAHRDSIFLSFCVTINSLLSGMVLFSGLGILAKETGQDVEIKVNEYSKLLDIDIEVIYSQLFTRMPYGTQHFSAAMFFFLQCFAGWYSLISYTEVFNVALFSTGMFKSSKQYKLHANIVICAFCFLVGSLMCSSEGYKYVQSLDKYVVGLSLIIITLCELIGVVYIYGVFDLCDDIEFMLGVYPNVYYQITWICVPVMLLLSLAYEIYEITQLQLTTPDLVMCGVILVCIVCPVLIRSLYNLIKSISSGDLSQILYPREVIIHDANDPSMYMYPYMSPTHKNVVSFKPEVTRNLSDDDYSL